MISVQAFGLVLALPVIALGTLSCAEPANFKSLTSPPGIIEYGPISAVSGAVSGAKVLKCVEAKDDASRQLCDTVTTEAVREDQSSLKSFEITFRETDLNGDNADEIVVWESSWAGTSGGSLWILRKSQNGYEKLFEADAAWTPITLLTTSSNGWKNVSYHLTGGGVTPAFITVGHDGSSYQDGVKSSTKQPAGMILIEKAWKESVFGPVVKPT